MTFIIAHRGASGDAPENTLKAFELAIRQKADGIELDVMLSVDGHVVVTHDENARRLTGNKLKVRETSLKKLRELDYGEGEKIPTLDEVFDLVARRVEFINVEIKSTGFLTDGVEKKVLERVRKFKLEERVFISSFNLLHIWRMKRFNPLIKTGYIVSPHNWLVQQTPWVLLSGADTVNIEYRWCNRGRFKRYTDLRKPLWLWTVNQEEEMLRWLKHPEVEGIITNYPARLRKVMQETDK